MLTLCQEYLSTTASLPAPRRPVLEDMAEHPGGYDFGREQALFIACSTQVGVGCVDIPMS